MLGSPRIVQKKERLSGRSFFNILEVYSEELW